MRNKNLLFFLLLIPLYATAITSQRDPTKPPDSLESTFSFNDQGLLVQAIFIAPDRQVALINGQFVKPGDTIAEGTVVSIEANRVIISQGKKTLSLYLIPETIKQKHNKD